MYKMFTGIMAVLCLGGCAGISQQARSLVTYEGSFSALQNAPRKYEGQIVLLGGRIIETEITEGASEIMVLQLPLEYGGRPQETDRSEGRFLIRSSRTLDPSNYRFGELVSVVGEVTGLEVRPIGELDYVYPVIDPIEIKVWRADHERVFPNLFFNFGVSASF